MELPVRIDKQSGTPIYLQLGEQIRLLVRQGALRAGDPLPTVRSLAVELEINANTVARVYRDLQTAGWLRLERGVGTFVADDRGRQTSEDDFRTLEGKALELVRLGKHAGLTKTELSQLIESRWQEVNDHVSG